MDFFEIRPCCPLCTSEDSYEHFRVSYEESILSQFIERTYRHRGGLPTKYLKDGFYDLRECFACGMLYQSCIPTKKLLHRIYNPEFDCTVQNRKNLRKESGSMRFVHSDARQVKKFLRRKEKPAILDYGVGYGIFASFLVNSGFDVYGTELNDEAIAQAKLKGVNIISEHDVSQMKFDFINTDQVLEHILYPRSTIQLLCNSLKVNGVLKISVPKARMIRREFYKIDFANPRTFTAMTPLQHINVFPDRTMKFIAEHWGMTFKKPIQFDSRYPAYTLIRTLKRSFERDSGSAWLHKSDVSNERE